MKFAVMQPYLFPYLGYYQLVNAVDKFVFYDDVTFIKGGYINRNNILSNGKAQRFTIPVPGMSSNTLINELSFDSNVKKTLKTIEQSYKKAPYFEHVFPIIESVLSDDTRNVQHVCAKSVSLVFQYLGIKKEFELSSELDYDRALSAADKLIAMANILESNDYINSPGGMELYEKGFFAEHNVKLSFIKMKNISYQQGKNEFVPYLSMIDVLMWNSIEETKNILNEYEII